MDMFQDRKIPSNVVKISQVSFSIGVEPMFVKPINARVYILSRRSTVPDQIIEGESFRVPLSGDMVGFGDKLDSLLEIINKNESLYELILVEQEKQMGVALLEYVSPARWYQ